jgi:PPOX class probable F420-dependent enzyme
MPRTSLDDRDLALLRAPNFCHVATLRGDGAPSVVPVWVDTDGERVLLNGAGSRRWTHDLIDQGRATLTVQNLEDPYEYVSILGRLVEHGTDGAEAHIDELSRKYLGRDVYPDHREDDPRILLVVTPEEVRHHGGATSQGA